MYQAINNKESGLSVRTKLNAQNEELYQLDQNKNFGVVVLPTITDNADGTVTVGADGVINFSKVADSSESFFRINVTDTRTLTMTDESVTYIYCDYNGGSPIYDTTGSPNVFLTEARYVPVFRVTRYMNDLCVLSYDEYGIGAINKALFKDIALNGFERSSGLVLSTSGTRIATVSAGNIWFGTEYGGIYRYNGIILEHFEKEETEGLDSNRISSIVEDNDGNVWFGLLGNDRPEHDSKGGGGLSMYDGRVFRSFSISSNSVSSSLRDKDNNLWFGTWHGGVSKYDGKFENYTTDDGLVSNTINYLLLEKKRRG